MIYLLDVNALVALGFLNHEFHARVTTWVRSHNSPSLASCSITELGFARVLAQAPAYGFTVAQARTLLLRLKRTKKLRSHLHSRPSRYLGSSRLVRTPRQITRGHLSKLASANGAILATLDENIPGSYLIPK